MCGIFGFTGKDSNLLKEGLSIISHRGPDDSGTYLDKSISLGHRRLSIVDLSKSGRQPMSNEDGTVWIVYNGEIYNYLELKKNLRQKHKFISNTDTEVMIHLYEEKGIDFIDDLQGMFAFCIYDLKSEKIFLVRDRLGIKPLYYHISPKKLYFASEIKAILTDSSIKREVNLEALETYFTFRANTLEETFFKSIYKLPPGCFMLFDLKTKKHIIKRYWDLNFNSEEKNLSSYKKELRYLLEDSVKSRLMSDVPYGAFLSGGVDSATIVALMTKYSQQKIKTFSVGFDVENLSETKEARATSNVLGTDHHELIIGEDSIKNLPDIIRHTDEPIADPTCIPTYLLSKYAKKYCRVILTGEGADEIFAGYPQYKFMRLNSMVFRYLPLFLKRAIGNFLNFVPTNFLDIYFPFTSSLGKKGLERFSQYLNSNKAEEQYLSQVSIFNEEEQSKLLGKEVVLYEKYRKYFNNSTRKNIVSRCESLDIKNSMVEDLLMKVDKNMMAFGIEGRVPFLDYRIVELATRIPDRYKITAFFKGKAILRDVASAMLPKKIAERKKKHFFVPIDVWLDKYLTNLRGHLLSKDYIKKQGLFNWDYIEEVNKNHKNSSLFYARQLWALITFQIWYRMYIEQKEVTI